MMGAETFRVLAQATMVASLACALIGLLRKPLRVAVGARVAYWLWLIVPAMLVAVLLPAPSVLLLARVNVLPAPVSSAITAVTSGPPASSRAVLIDFALAIWSIGAGTMLFSMFARQRSFMRSLGALTRDAQGIYRGAVCAPMLIGVWQPKIVVPMDFAHRYSAQERELVLAHERAHAARHDVAVNAIASLALCVFWFNPLNYRALEWLRMDQELACDALVLSRRGGARRHYADALLKTQLATESAWRQAVGCHWQSIHPLKERVAMLKRPLPARTRRLTGIGFIAVLTGLAAYATWAGQSAGAPGPAILVDLKVRITNPRAHELNDLATEYLVNSGETIPDTRNDGGPLRKTDKFVACTPYLADTKGRSTDWSALKARGVPIPAAGQILLDCRIYQNGEIVQRPSVITNDGNPAIIETTDTDGSYHYRLEVTATTSPKKIVAAVKITEDRRQSGKN
jgi:bla regulator protein BlaR1